MLFLQTQPTSPLHRLAPPNSIYCFDNWGYQLVDFIKEVIGSEATLSSNSVGGEQGHAMRDLECVIWSRVFTWNSSAELQLSSCPLWLCNIQGGGTIT